MEQKDNFKIIEKFLRGQMTSEEETAFKEQIKNDKELREEVRMTALLVKEMRRQRTTERDAIQEAAQQSVAAQVPAARVAKAEMVCDEASVVANASATVASGRSFTQRFAMWSSMVAAAMFVLFFGTKTVYLNTQSNRLVGEYYAAWTPDDTSLSRGATTEQDERQVVLTLDTLFNSVNQKGNLKQTIARLQSSLKMAETDETYFYYYEDIEWYLALAYVKAQRYPEARTLLQTIVKRGDIYAVQAKKLYDEIEDLYFL